MPETTELMKRPSKSDALVTKRAWEIFMPSVKKYLGAEWSDNEAPHVQKQIMEVMASGDDGYSMARRLESRYSWAEDRALVDLMDSAEDALREAHDELTGQWIKTYGIEAGRKIGDTVSTTHWRRKGQVGTINTIYADRAQYAVHFSDMPAKSAQILYFEEVIDAPAEVPANA